MVRKEEFRTKWVDETRVLSSSKLPEIYIRKRIVESCTENETSLG